MAIYQPGLTALTTKGAMPRTSATPPSVLFLLESAYIRNVVNTSMSRQPAWFGRVLCKLTGGSN